MQQTICERLSRVAKDQCVSILYACESGSRAWGFPSMDSDYDVRFLYVHPVDWYLSIDAKRDVIELPLDQGLDISGWDLTKALQLLRRSNPPLLEWIGSPIIYSEKPSLISKLRAMALEYYSPMACRYHYLHMAQTNFREYLKGSLVWAKKYFYVLRPVLAIQWIDAGLGMVPTDFNVLVKQLLTEPVLRSVIDQLIERKRAGAELDRGPRIEIISRFIETKLELWEKEPYLEHAKNSPESNLDAFFREALSEAW